MESYVFGLDLGQASDYTALAVVEPAGEEFHIRHIQRYDLGVSYPAIVAAVQERMADERLADPALVLDATGVGAPVVDMFRLAGLKPIAVTITGGSTVTQEGDDYRVPKRDLVGAAQVALQTEKLKIANELPHVRLLVNELLAFRVKIDPKTAHDSYSSWRERDHDDLVLAVCLAVWYAKTRPAPPKAIDNIFWDGGEVASALPDPRAKHNGSVGHRRWSMTHYCPDCARERAGLVNVIG